MPLIIYTGITEKVHTGHVKKGIKDSAMTDKDYDSSSISYDSEAETFEIFFTNTLSAPDKTILDGIVGAAEGQTDVGDFISANIENYRITVPQLEDSFSGEFGPTLLMQSLKNWRALEGDSDNPLCPSGYSKALVPRMAEVEKGNFSPKALVIYYGTDLSDFNGSLNDSTNELVAQNLAQYDVVVLGVALVGSSQSSNTASIMARVKVLKPDVLIFGQVSVDQNISSFEDDVDDWNTALSDGIFLTEAGYDDGRTRAEFNTRVDYVHGMTVANKCFASALNTDHLLGTANDTSYPNTTYNSSEVESNLVASDWIHVPSFAIDTTVYTASTPDGYEAKADWVARGVKAVSLKSTYGLNFAASGIIENGSSKGQALFDFGFISALMFSFEAWGTSDTGFAATSEAVVKWDRLDISNLSGVKDPSPAVIIDGADTDVYWRFLRNAVMSLDFSTSAQRALIQSEKVKSNDIRRVSQVFDDFIGPDIDSNVWATDVAGAGSNVTSIQESNGVQRLRTDGAAGDYCEINTAIKHVGVTSLSCLQVGVKLAQTDDAEAFIGLYDDDDNLIEFRADDTGSGFWYTTTIASGTSSDASTGIALDTNYHHLEISMHGAKVVCKIDGATVAVHSANIPTSDMRVRIRIERVGGSADRDLHIDYIKLLSERGY